MRFLMVHTCEQAFAASPPTPELIAKMAAFTEALVARGALVDFGGTFPTAADARVRLAGGVARVTDGPFTEAKEVVGGFAIVQVASRAEAVALAEAFLRVVEIGEAHVHQLMDGPPPA